MTLMAGKKSSNPNGIEEIHVTNHAAHVALREGVIHPIQSAIELLAAGTALAATVESPVWIDTRKFDTGSLLVSVIGAEHTGGTLDVRYSFDGGATTTQWQTIKNLVGGASEDIIVEFGQKVNNADAAGFESLIKRIPFMQFRITATGTITTDIIGMWAFLEGFDYV